MDEIERKINEKMTERKDLCLKINELDKKFENNKLKRCLTTIAFYTVVNMILSYFALDVAGNEINLTSILGTFIPSVVLAGISFLVNATIFSGHFTKSDAENATITSMEKRLTEIDGELGKLREMYQR